MNIFSRMKLFGLGAWLCRQRDASLTIDPFEGNVSWIVPSLGTTTKDGHQALQDPSLGACHLTSHAFVLDPNCFPGPSMHDYLWRSCCLADVLIMFSYLEQK